jgi:hypothetical protein
LGGNGRINAELNNLGGTVAPGTSVGTLTLNSHFSQDADGMLEIELMGSGEGEYDRLVVAGIATLEGKLAVSFLNGFVPRVGDVFTVLTAQNVLNLGLTLESGLAAGLRLAVGPSSVALVAVPEPAGGLLAVIALGCFVRCRPRRRRTR